MFETCSHNTESESNRTGSDEKSRAQFKMKRARCIVTYSTLSATAIRRAIGLQYEFSGRLDCVFFNRGVSDTYLLSCDGRRFALKLHRANWRSQEAILAEIDALSHFGHKGVEVAMPIRRKDGNWLTEVPAPEGRRLAVLFEWAPGQTPTYTDAQHCLKYGRLVARLHLAGDSLTSSKYRPKMDADYLLKYPMSRVASRLPESPSVQKRFEELCTHILNRLNEAETQLKDWGFCHGDIYPNNACVDGDTLTLFDFDFCGSGWRIYDLATYRWEARRQGVEDNAWEPFIRGYCEIRPGGSDSLEFIGLFMAIRHIWTAAHWVGLSPELGISFPPAEFLNELVPFCERLESVAH